MASTSKKQPTSADLDDHEISEFCSVTGADPDTARHYLEAADHDLAVAANLFLEGGGSASKSPILEREVRAPIRPKMAVLQDQSPSALFRPFPFSPLNDPAEPFRDRSSIFGRPSGQFDEEELLREDDAKRRLAYLFRAPTEIIFVGPFDDARREARKPTDDLPFRHLLATLHRSTEFACQAMNRDVWNDKLVQQVVRQNFIFVQLTWGTSEGTRFQTNYAVPADVYPYVAIVDPRTGERVREWAGKSWKAAEMIEALVDFMSRQEANVSTEAHDAIEPLTASEERSGLQTSPATPRQARELPLEPEASDPSATTIQFRLPDGRRVKRRFFQTDSVHVLEDYAFSLLPSSEGDRGIDLHTAGGGSVLYHPRNKTLVDAGLRNVMLTVVVLGREAA